VVPVVGVAVEPLEVDPEVVGVLDPELVDSVD
jgi:hypothetical protein